MPGGGPERRGVQPGSGARRRAPAGCCARPARAGGRRRRRARSTLGESAKNCAGCIVVCAGFAAVLGVFAHDYSILPDGARPGARPGVPSGVRLPRRDACEHEERGDGLPRGSPGLKFKYPNYVEKICTQNKSPFQAVHR